MPISGRTVSMATTCPPAVRRRRHSRVHYVQVPENRRAEAQPFVAAHKHALQNRQTVDGEARRSISIFCCCRNRRLLGRRSVFSNAAAATAGGLAPQRFLAERTEVPERPITTYGTRRCIRVLMKVPKLPHEQRSEVPELMPTPPWPVSST